MRQVRRGTAGIRVQYRSAVGELVDTTLDLVAAGELAQSQPVREFRWYKGQRHYSGWYRSSTMEGLVAYESRLELARIMLADFDPDVTVIAGQPFRLIGSDGNRIRRHVPDILLMMSDGGVTVVDVKSPHKRDDPDVRAVMSGPGGRSGCAGGGSRTGTVPIRSCWTTCGSWPVTGAPSSLTRP
jgi:hypothetical protein